MKKFLSFFLIGIFLFISYGSADVLTSEWENASIEELQEAYTLIGEKIDALKNVNDTQSNAEINVLVKKEATEENFIKDLSVGLSKRWEMSGADTSTFSEAKQKEFLTKLVNLELDEIGAYSGVVFSDKVLGEYAATYLSALQDQWIAVNEYLGVDEELYNEYWMSGRAKRAQMIYWINKKYGLDIPETNNDSFVELVNVGYAQDIYFSVEESLTRQLRAVDLSFKNGDNKLSQAAFTLTNDSGYHISWLQIDLEYLDDKENVIDSVPLYAESNVSSKAQINVQQRAVYIDSFSNVRFGVQYHIETNAYYDQYTLSVVPDIQYSYIDSKIKRNGELASGQPNLEIQNLSYNWDYMYSTLYAPRVKLSVKNSGNAPANKVVVHCVFKDKSTQEIWDEDTVYVIGSSDVPLAPGYSKNAILKSSAGYTSAPDELPNLTVDIYINDVLIQSIDSLTE